MDLDMNQGMHEIRRAGEKSAFNTDSEGAA